MSYKDEDNFIIAISRLEILLLKTWRVEGGGGGGRELYDKE